MLTSSSSTTLPASPSRAISLGPIPAGGTMQFSLAARTVNEAIGTLTVTVTRTGGSSGPVSEAYASFDATATAPADCAAASGIQLGRWRHLTKELQREQR